MKTRFITVPMADVSVEKLVPLMYSLVGMHEETRHNIHQGGMQQGKTALVKGCRMHLRRICPTNTSDNRRSIQGLLCQTFAYCMKLVMSRLESTRRQERLNCAMTS